MSYVLTGNTRGLGFSLKPPKIVRKVVGAVAKVASVAVALAPIPGAGVVAKALTKLPGLATAARVAKALPGAATATRIVKAASAPLSVRKLPTIAPIKSGGLLPTLQRAAGVTTAISLVPKLLPRRVPVPSPVASAPVLTMPSAAPQVDPVLVAPASSPVPVQAPAPIMTPAPVGTTWTPDASPASPAARSVDASDASGPDSGITPMLVLGALAAIAFVSSRRRS